MSSSLRGPDRLTDVFLFHVRKFRLTNMVRLSTSHRQWPDIGGGFVTPIASRRDLGGDYLKSMLSLRGPWPILLTHTPLCQELRPSSRFLAAQTQHIIKPFPAQKRLASQPAAPSLSSVRREDGGGGVQNVRRHLFFFLQPTIQPS